MLLASPAWKERLKSAADANPRAEAVEADRLT
jgi:hypothetical protein